MSLKGRRGGRPVIAAEGGIGASGSQPVYAAKRVLTHIQRQREERMRGNGGQTAGQLLSKTLMANNVAGRGQKN